MRRVAESRSFPRNFFTFGVARRSIGGEDASALPPAAPTEDRRKCSHHVKRSYTILFRARRQFRFNLLNPSAIVLALGRSVDVWDNLMLTARKLLILKTERCPSGLRSTLGKRV